MSRPSYRMYAGIRCKTVEYMVERYLQHILNYTWYSDWRKCECYLTQLYAVKIYGNMNSLNIAHHCEPNYNGIDNEFNIIREKFANELNITDDRILRFKKCRGDMIRIKIKIDPDFIYSLVGYFRMNGYKDETQY